MFPVHSTSRAAVGLGVFLHIFNVGKVILVQVEVQSAWIMTETDEVAQRLLEWNLGHLFLCLLLPLHPVWWVRGNRQRC